MASAYLTRTPSSAGTTTKCTISVWLKRSGLGNGSTENRIIIQGDADGNPASFLKFKTDDTLEIVSYKGSYDYRLITNRVFRDTSAWYHIVMSVDTTQATSSDRVKIYVNGVQETSFSTSTYPSQNYTTLWNTTSSIWIGQNGSSAEYFDGSMTHFHLIDGTAYQASDFGESDSTSGIWKPKTSPSVTYGTNGFFLDFADSSAMGDDESGNTNDFTVNGTITQTEDTPSNNFCTMNPLQVRVSSSGTAYPTTFSNGNTKNESSNTSAYTPAVGTLGVSSGKWYFECKMGTLGYTSFADSPSIGIKSLDAGLYNNEYDDTLRAYVRNGNKVLDSTTSSFGNTYTTGDIIGVAMDLDNGAVYFSKNGTWQNSGDPTSGSSKTGALATDMASYENWSPCCMGYNGGSGSNAVWEWNFGNGRFGTTALASSNSDSAGLGLFEYSVPSGYYSLCTKNIKNYG
jgi:hypothetical protein